MLAARADGRTDSREQQAVDAVVARIGDPDVSHLADQVAKRQLKALFNRFQQDAKTIYPKVEAQIQKQAGTLNLQNLLAGLRTT